MPTPESDTDPVHDVHPLAQRGAEPRRPSPWLDGGVEVIDDSTAHFDLPSHGLGPRNPAARWPLPGPRRRTIEELRAEIDDEIGRQLDGTRAGEDDGTLTDAGDLVDELHYLRPPISCPPVPAGTPRSTVRSSSSHITIVCPCGVDVVAVRRSEWVGSAAEARAGQPMVCEHR